MKTLLSLMIVGFSMSLAAAEEVVEEVKFEKSELARDAVLPVFRNQVVVKSRTVETEGRFEIAGIFGKTMNDAFYDNYPVILQGNYHLNEKHGVQIEYGIYSSSQNSFVGQVQDRNSYFQLDEVPTLDSMYSLLWEYTPYYGKISFSKDTVYNLSIYTIVGYGQLQYSGPNISESSSVFHLGLGEKLYFSKNFGLKLDLRAKFYQFPAFVSKAGDTKSAPVPPFDNESVFNTELSVGLLYIF